MCLALFQTHTALLLYYTAMRIHLFLTFLCGYTATALTAQTVPWNLVRNYSFEDYSDSLYLGGDIDTTVAVQRVLPAWFSASVTGSPDYFNSCHRIPNTFFATPHNGYAYQQPYHGNAYTGLNLTAGYSLGGEFREYLQTKLIGKLKSNKKYCIGTQVNFAYDANASNLIDDVVATKNLGIFVSQNRVFNSNAAPPNSLIIVANSQVSNNQYLIDTLNWVLLKNIVVGNGEEWLTIGNFSQEWQSDTIMVYNAPHTTSTHAYYFIDNVFVIPMENDEALLHRDTAVCAAAFPLQLQANDGFTGYSWNNGTQSNVLQVSAAGTYTVSATYAGCTIVDTIRVRLRVPPTGFSLAPKSYCRDSLPISYTLPDTVATRYPNFVWSTAASGANVTIAASGTYTVTATSECGANTATLVVTTQDAPPDFSLGRDTTPCQNGHLSPVLLHSDTLLTNYLWSFNAAVVGNMTTFLATQAGIYTLQSSNICGSKKSSLTINGCEPSIYIPTAFTPNGDGHNDNFTLYSNDAVKIIKRFEVFDRYGEMVFSAKNIAPNDESAGWNGTMEGQAFTPDVFVYLIEVEYLDGTMELLKGDVTLVK
jgi:gliding motility-associated-like protein